MERFVKGEVVVVWFPFSDLSDSKKRPALVLADLNGDDVILCQITSQNFTDDYRIELVNKDFKRGNILTNSYIRPNRIFTADKQIISKSLGVISTHKLNEVYRSIYEIFEKD